MNSIKITYPYLLFLILPLAILIVLGFFFIPKKKKKRPNNIISLILHLVLAVTLSLTFSDVQYLKSDDKNECYVLVDCSDSEKNNVDKIDQKVEEVFSEAKQNKAHPGLVCFSKEAMVYIKEGGSFKSVRDVFDKEKYPDFSTSSSDIASALTYTQSLFSSDASKRIVLVSDGVETDNSALDVISTLVTDGIRIDALSLQSAFENEAQISSIDYVDRCYTGKEQEVTVLIQSSKENTAKIRLQSQGELKEEKETTLSSGYNSVTFYVSSEEPKTIEYEVDLIIDGDTLTENNHMTFSQEYTDDFSVLFIGDTEDDLTAFESIHAYDSKTKITSYVDTNNVPYKLADLLSYDEIVLSNINIMMLNHYEDFAKNLNSAVKNYGKSVLTFGATYTTSNGASVVNDYNDILPVQYESDDAKALVLLIDCSGSMKDENRLDIAKKGAIKCLDVLSDKDYVSIISFSSTVTIHQPMTSVKNKKQIINAINQIALGGGTMLGAGLKQAYRQIVDSNCEYKNIIALTDGEPSETATELKRLVTNMAADNIVSSFINISSSKGANLLMNLAEAGNGNYYFCRSAAGLINIMLSSVSGEIGNTEIEEQAEIQYRLSSDPTLENITSLPDIQGYNYCRIKANTNTVLTVQYQKKDEEGNTTGVASIPLYAYWNFGKGKVSSFTSNLASDWTKNFRASEDGMRFLKNCVTQALPDRAIHTLMDLKTEVHGYTMGLSIKGGENGQIGKIHVKVINPDKNSTEQDLVYDSQNEVYQGTTSISTKGKYQVIATYYEKQEDDSYLETEMDEFYFYYDFSDEYNVLPEKDGDTLLSEIVRESNGTLYDDENPYTYALTQDDLQHVSYVSLMMPLLLISVILYLIDIFIRKTTFRKKAKKVKED